MEDTLVSKHVLDMSQYAGKGKWKGVVIVWTVVISILLATRFSFIQTEITDFAISVCGVQGGTKNANFLINEFWVALIPLAIGTFILWRRKQSFSEIRIYENSIGFVLLDGKEHRVRHEQVYVHYGKYQKTFWIECAALGISNYYYYWDDFSNSEVLCDNLLHYANWNMNKYQKQ